MQINQIMMVLLVLIIPLRGLTFDQAVLERESILLREKGGVGQIYGESKPGTHLSAQPIGESLSSNIEAVESSLENREKTRSHLLGEVDESWLRPPGQIVEQDFSQNDEQEEVMNRLEKIFIPKVEFRELPISQVVEALAELTEGNEIDGSGINIVLIDPDGRDPRVSIILRRLSLLRILDFVVESVGFEYNLQEDAVVIRPRQGPGFGLETAFYPISRSTLIRLTGIHEGEDLREVETIPDPFAPVESNSENRRLKSELSLKSFLQRAGISFDGVEGADLALADGQLIVTQTPRNHDKLTHLLRRYREVKQVEIEARFLEVQERNLEELGLEWTLVNSSGSKSFTTVGRDLASAFTIGQEESDIVIDRVGLNLPRIGQGAPILPVTVDLAENAADQRALRISSAPQSLAVDPAG
jgi:general secretion pathway protein D